MCDTLDVPPATRARFAQSIMVEVMRLHPSQREEIRKRCGMVWQKIEETPPVAWLDETTYNTLTDSIRAQLGNEQTIRLYRGLGRRILENPNFQSFIESVIRLFGLSPHTLLKAAPRGREAVVRDSGTLTYEQVTPYCAKLHLRNFPASTFKSGTTVVLLSGTFLGLLDAAGVSKTARVETTGVDLLAGNATFVLSW